MDSNRLRYFLAVAETGSVRRAADVLHLSPAALSKAIKVLEAECGFALLAPAGRGIVVTPEGRKLAGRAKPLMERLGSLAREIGQEKGEASRIVRIGSFEVFTTHFLRPLLRAIPDEARLLLREVIPGELESALTAGEIDLGITYLPIPTSGVSHLRVTSIRMGIYGRKEAFGGKPFDEIAFAIPVQPLKGVPNKVQGLDGWPDGRIARNVRYRVTLMESALELCRNGLAVAYLPTFVAQLHNGSVRRELRLHEYPLPKRLGAPSQPVYIAHRKDHPEDRLIRDVARVLRETCTRL